MHSALLSLSSRYKQVGNAFLTDSAGEEQYIRCSVVYGACQVHKETSFVFRKVRQTEVFYNFSLFNVCDVCAIPQSISF